MDRKTEIMTKALEIITEEGIQGLTIKKLAAGVEVTEGALYRHFSGKKEILAAIAAMFRQETTGILEDLAGSDAPVLDKIEAFFTGRCRQFTARPGLAPVMFSEDLFKGYSDLKEQAMATMHEHGKILKDLLREGQKKGIIRPGEVPHLFMVVMGALRLLVTRWLAGGKTFNLVSEGEALWRTLSVLLTASEGEPNET